MGHFPHDVEVIVNCRPGGTISSILREVNNLPSDRDTDLVILHIGGNDMSNLRRNETTDYVIGDLLNLVERIKEKFVKAKIIVSGILWRKGLTRRLLDQVNNDIKWILSNLPYVSFATATNFISIAHYAPDRIHLNSKGTKIFANFLKNLFCLAADLDS